MTRVLVTGASGFVGRAALEALARHGFEVHAASRRKPDTAAPHVWREADLLDPRSPSRVVNGARPDIILHLAWIVEHGVFWTSPRNPDWVGASLALARAGAEAGARYFIGAGTCYEYDWPADGACSEVHTPLKPAQPYSIAKDAARRGIEAMSAEAGFAFAWARLFFLYGPGEGPNRLVPGLARALLAGEPAKCSSGRAVRDFIDVRDAGEALAAVALSGLSGPVNIASGEGVSVAEIAKKLGDLSGRPDLVRVGALADRPDEPPRIVADVTRLRTETAFRPTWTLDAGLRDALRYWSLPDRDVAPR
jgi:nucleoside-diphosphate-sugar epimerase